MKKLIILGFVMLGCSGSAVDSKPLPATCKIEKESVRLQLCPDQDMAIVCSNTAQTNIDEDYCVGWAANQITGNAWCCSKQANFTTH